MGFLIWDLLGDKMLDFRACLRLAPLSDPLKYASISGSHSNQALRLWCYGSAHGGECSSNGVLHTDLLHAHDPVYHTAVLQGLCWEIISFEVTEKFQQFVGLAQSAANAAGQVMQTESELQICRRVKSFFKADGTIPSYSDVEKVILRSRPPSPLVIPSLWQFMVKYSGGPTAHYMDLTEQYVRANGFPSRTLGSNVWDALSVELKLPNQEQLVLWRHSMLKCLLCLPDKVVSATDIKKGMQMVSLAQKVIAYQRVLTKLNSHALKHTDLNMHQRTSAIGTFEVCAVLTILQKKSKSDETRYRMFDSVEEAAHHCCETLQSESKVSIVSPWADSASVPAAPSSSAKGAKDKARTGCVYAQLKFACWVLNIDIYIGLSHDLRAREDA